MVVGGVVLYLRFVRGWRLADMMYVTKGALVNMQESVNSSERGGGGGVRVGSMHQVGREGSTARESAPSFRMPT